MKFLLICAILGVALVSIEAHPQTKELSSSVQNTTTTKNNTTTTPEDDDDDDSDELLSREVFDGRNCPINDTTITISALIPITKTVNIQKALDSVNCTTFNYCGTGNTSLNCPTLPQDWKTSIKKALALSFLFSNIAPGVIHAKLNFSPVEIHLRYVKFGKINKTLINIPDTWNDFTVDFKEKKNLNSTYVVKSSLDFKSRDDFNKEITQDSTAQKQAKRVDDWFEMIFDAETPKGSVIAVEKIGDKSWTMFDVKISYANQEQNWTRNKFGESITKFNDEYEAFCICQNVEKEKCKAKSQFQKFVKFYDTESLVCKHAKAD